MMSVKVTLNGGAIKEYEGGDFVMEAEPNEHGDLVVFRAHISMPPQVVASHAAGEWVSHETIWEEVKWLKS